VLLAVAIAAATGMHDARAQDVRTHNCLPTPPDAQAHGHELAIAKRLFVMAVTSPKPGHR
jgi:hypothetical protein